MSFDTYVCGQYRLTIEHTPDAPPDQKICVFARLPSGNGSAGMDEIVHEMSIPCFVQCMVAGIRAMKDGRSTRQRA